MHPKCVLFGDIVDDQSLGRSCNIFPQSCAIRSYDIARGMESHDISHVGLCDSFPGSHGQIPILVTWL